MNPKYEIHEWIDRYLNGEMNDSERLEFETQLRTDDHLAKTLEAQKIANQLVIGEELLQLKKRMSKDLGTGNYSKGIPSKPWRYFLYGAALVVATAIIIYLLKNKSTQVQEEETNQKESTGMDRRTSHENDLALVEVSDNCDSIEAAEQILAKQTNTNIVDEVNNTSSAKDKNNETTTCSDSLINFSCQARGTCIQKNEGVIEIDINTIKSAKAPFKYALTVDGAFQEEPVISDLKPGKYNLFVKDSNQCIHKLNEEVEVPIINCGNNLLLK